MGGFVLAAALLVAVTLVVLLRPWNRKPKAAAGSTSDVNAGIYRDQLAELDRDLAAGTLSAEDHAQARAELQRRLLDDVSATDTPAVTTGGMKHTVLVLALTLPLAAAGLYTWLGTPAALDPLARAAPTQQNVEKMVADLAARMEKNPDPRGFVVLARSYRAMGRLPEAEAAFERIGPALQENATLLAEYADVLASRAMGNLEGKPMALIDQALKLEPENPMALSLAATAAYNRSDYAQAITRWQQILRVVPPDSEDARWLNDAIAKTREQLAGVGGTAKAPAATAAATATPSPKTTAAGASVSGRVSLAPALAAKVQPGDTVFIFARNPQGSRLPLAVQRIQVSALPFSFKLDDSMAMSPEAKISGASEVRIEARVSRSGNATPQSGDLIGASATVKPGADKVEVVIDQVRP
ncbi:c-type cytochrome biogenesis protein CcmI [Piscinibacter gummiphilus]|uniref:C-type cytochrome biogenesis protein CcmI n=1 Tax=Piscinibacter gummiphilus TaxID=946333 RepID=A0ABZ0CP14_9BURK|nr:c-type cytochrome biogenesis protein CcmI [Piscinibacter gummiphilus]WOB06593.1 c-type cytochrome biogenesis protein CcmI [Piscinibacter gummiphilus]